MLFFLFFINYVNELPLISSLPQATESMRTLYKDCIVHKEEVMGHITFTVFTSFDYIESKFIANQNALKNWKAIKGVKNFVLFTNCSRARKLGKSMNFVVLPVMDSAIGGVPVLKSMYLKVLALYPTSYIMFSNADIMYEIDLMETVRFVNSFVQDEGLARKPVLIVGKRTNLDIDSGKNESWKSLITKTATLGTIFNADALDYFIFDRKFPWKAFPKFVIGRVGYDNWIVAFSRYKNFTVVDATGSILAVHQTINGANFEGFSHNHFSYNRDLIAESLPSYQYALWGRTECCFLETGYDSCGQLYVKNRTLVPPYCFHHNFLHDIKKLFKTLFGLGCT
ncbi:unnamed protein product [Mytilus coruscus]|uniref:Uncharacterized protein n=1 Tax=Mytilus coruscus TaxID=42192 RepID=A0A6J8BCC7_MYTCO|nr:unnamed protein product [Mytilus coruscus]